MSSSYIPALQSEVREFLELERRIEEAKTDLNKAKAVVKGLDTKSGEAKKRIIELMEKLKITSCTAGPVKLEVREKEKKPALSAKLVKNHVKSFFMISDAQWDKCMETLDTVRQSQAKLDVSLAKKVLRRDGGAEIPALPAPLIDPPHSSAERLQEQHPASSLYA
jgi:hypothetical protein